MTHVNNAQSPLHTTTSPSYALAKRERDADLYRYYQEGRQRAEEVFYKEDLAELHDTIDRYAAQLEDAQAEIRQYQARLGGAQAEVNQYKAELEETQALADQYRTQVDDHYKAQLKCVQAEIDQTRSQLISLQGAYDELQRRVSPAYVELATAAPDLNVVLSSPPRRASSLLMQEASVDSDDLFIYPGSLSLTESDKNDVKPGPELVNEDPENLIHEIRWDHPSPAPSSPIPDPLDRPLGIPSSTVQDLEESDIEIPPTPESCSPPPHLDSYLHQLPLQITSAEKIRELMERAHSINGEAALAQVRWLLSRAHTTLPTQRSEAHRVLLAEWRPPSSIGSVTSGEQSSTLSLFPHLNHVYVDASEVGIGFVFAGKWETWRLRKGWKHGGGKQGKIRHIQWAEAVAVELGVRLMVKAGYAGNEITLCSDNMQVVRAFSQQRLTTGDPLADEVVDNTCKLCFQQNIRLRVLWISGLLNPADAPSRLNFQGCGVRFPFYVEIPPYLQDVVVPFYQ
jgi:hypothetical protein